MPLILGQITYTKDVSMVRWRDNMEKIGDCFDNAYWPPYRKKEVRMGFKSNYPDFKPNLTPRDMFRMGSFGGTYWRPICEQFN